MKLYIDPIATTSRAVVAMCHHEHIEVELKGISIMKGEQHAPAFARLNPNCLVPVLVDGDLVLTESSAILRYLARKHGSSLYPAALRDAARVDEMLAWFESNFYKDFGYQFVLPQVLPHHGRGSEEATRATIEWGRQGAHRWLAVLEGHYLGRGPFLTGSQPSIADLHGAAILSLAELVDWPLDSYPRVRAWLARMDEFAAWRRACEQYKAFAASVRGRQRSEGGAERAAAA